MVFQPCALRHGSVGLEPVPLVPVRVSRRLSRLEAQLGWLADVEARDKQRLGEAIADGLEALAREKIWPSD